MNINNFSNPLHLNNVKVNDNYFNEYLNLIKTVVIPYQYNALNDLIPGAPKSYCISNFIKASSVCSSLKASIPVPVFPVDKWEYKETECSSNSFLGWCFQDTDAYKWIEAASYVLVNKKNDALRKQVDIICHKAGSFTFRQFLCPNTAFYGGIRALFLYLKILRELLRDSKRQQISKFQSHFSAI